MSLETRFLTAFLATAAALQAAGPSAAQNLDAANRRYQQGLYAEAAEEYLALLRADPDSAALRYNLGNAAIKEGSPGSLGRATAQYLRAWRLHPRDPDIRHNLDFALRRSGDSLVPSGVPRALHLLFHFFSEKELLGLQWLGYWACLSLGSVLLAFPKRRSRLRPCLAAALAFWAVGLSWWGLRRFCGPSNLAVVLQADVEARSGPGDRFPVGFNAPEGRRASILSDKGNWIEIMLLKEGLAGWVPARAVERI